MPEEAFVREEVVAYAGVVGGVAAAPVIEQIVAYTSPARQGDPGPKGDTGEGDPGPPGQGFTWRGAWDSMTNYLPYDVAQYDGSSWVAVAASLNVAPGTDPSKWELQAERGDVGADLTHVHTQLVASDSWAVNHGLGKWPSVTVVDSAGDYVEGDINFVDANNVLLRFSVPFGGRAFFN